MYKLIRITGRKCRKIKNLIFLLQEGVEMSTSEILGHVQNKRGLPMTVGELSNVLTKYGCFQHVGYVTKASMLSGNYQVKTWSLDYNGILKKYKTDDYTQCNRDGKMALFNTTTFEFSPVSKFAKLGLWDGIKAELEGKPNDIQ